MARTEKIELSASDELETLRAQLAELEQHRATITSSKALQANRVLAGEFDKLISDKKRKIQALETSETHRIQQELIIDETSRIAEVIKSLDGIREETRNKAIDAVLKLVPAGAKKSPNPVVIAPSEAIDLSAVNPEVLAKRIKQVDGLLVQTSYKLLYGEIPYVTLEDVLRNWKAIISLRGIGPTSRTDLFNMMIGEGVPREILDQLKKSY